MIDQLLCTVTKWEDPVTKYGSLVFPPTQRAVETGSDMPTAIVIFTIITENSGIHIECMVVILLPYWHTLLAY